jgi:hypothetical protein
VHLTIVPLIWVHECGGSITIHLCTLDLLCIVKIVELDNEVV